MPQSLSDSLEDYLEAIFQVEKVKKGRGNVIIIKETKE